MLAIRRTLRLWRRGVRAPGREASLLPITSSTKLLRGKFSDAILAAGAGGQLRIERITEERFDAAYKLRIRYRDKPGISFTDLTSFVVMRELGVKHVLTADAHFTQVQLGFLCVP
jgi:predicted nucleic acid-binding protein